MLAAGDAAFVRKASLGVSVRTFQMLFQKTFALPGSPLLAYQEPSLTIYLQHLAAIIEHLFIK